MKKTILAASVAPVTTALACLAPAKLGWAQVILERQPSSAPPMSDPPSSVMTITAVVTAAVVVLVMLAALAKMADLRRKRETEAVVIQARISDAILRDPRLFSLPVTPTARVPLWKGSPVTIEVAGQVPSEDLRDAALRLIEREAAQAHRDVRIESRIGVVPTMVRQSA